MRSEKEKRDRVNLTSALPTTNTIQGLKHKQPREKGGIAGVRNCGLSLPGGVEVPLRFNTDGEKGKERL